MDGAGALPLPDGAVRTTCPYCGVGCGLVARPDGRGGAAVQGDKEHPANLGRLCSKGTALGETLSLDDRLLQPEIDGVQVGWDAALDAVADRFRRVLREHGPDAVALYVSGQLLTEDYYVANKLAKGFLGTANIDTNSRLCMASSVAGHRRAFGADIVPGNYEDLEAADLVVLVGSNLAWCHPVLFQRLVAARKRRYLKLVVIDPRRTATAEEADLHLALKPGTDVALFNGLLSHLARARRRDDKFVEKHTIGDRAALAAANAVGGAAAVAAACGVSEEKLSLFFNWFAEHRRTVTVYSQGVNQSSAGTDKVNAIINCHLFTGRIGQPGMGPFSVTGQPNAMGGREVGALANQLAAHMDFAAEEVDRVRRFWSAPRMATKPGLKAVDLFRAVADGKIKALWIMATNPAVSLPEADQVRRALEICPFVVVSDCVSRTDTSAHAHVKLPALGWGEKDGTVTNSERRISRQRAFLAPPGEAKPDWWIVSAVAQRLGFEKEFSYHSAADVFREHAALSAFENNGSRDFDLGGLAGIDDVAYGTLKPVQWPVPASTMVSSPRFFAEGRFYTPDQRAKFIAVAQRAPTSQPDADYPLTLNTGRVRDHWHTMTRTGRAPRLSQHTSEPMIDIGADDARAAGVEDNRLARIETRHGSLVGRVRVGDALRPGEIFVPMHWNDQFAAAARVNAAVNPAVDPVSGQPELKHTPARITPMPAAWFGFVLTRQRVALDRGLYWSLAAGDMHWRYEIGGNDDPAELARLFAVDGAQRLELADPGAGIFRTAWIRNGRLEACLFIGPTPDLPPRGWIEELFTLDELSDARRAGLLAGRMAVAAPASGPVVCACFRVTRGTILDAVAAGANSIEAIGKAVQAGTNCGSCQPELRRLLP